jgi:hypothetical protein
MSSRDGWTKNTPNRTALKAGGRLHAYAHQKFKLICGSQILTPRFSTTLARRQNAVLRYTCFKVSLLCSIIGDLEGVYTWNGTFGAAEQTFDETIFWLISAERPDQAEQSQHNQAQVLDWS